MKNAIGLNYAEFHAVCVACQCLRLDRCSPRLFRECVVDMVVDRLPALAAKVDRLDDGRLGRLCRAVTGHQQIMEARVNNARAHTSRGKVLPLEHGRKDVLPAAPALRLFHSGRYWARV